VFVLYWSVFRVHEILRNSWDEVKSLPGCTVDNKLSLMTLVVSKQLRYVSGRSRLEHIYNVMFVQGRGQCCAG